VAQGECVCHWTFPEVKPNMCEENYYSEEELTDLDVDCWEQVESYMLQNFPDDPLKDLFAQTHDCVGFGCEICFLLSLQSVETLVRYLKCELHRQRKTFDVLGRDQVKILRSKILPKLIELCCHWNLWKKQPRRKFHYGMAWTLDLKLSVPTTKQIRSGMDPYHPKKYDSEVLFEMCQNHSEDGSYISKIGYNSGFVWFVHGDYSRNDDYAIHGSTVEHMLVDWRHQSAERLSERDTSYCVPYYYEREGIHFNIAPFRTKDQRVMVDCERMVSSMRLDNNLIVVYQAVMQVLARDLEPKKVEVFWMYRLKEKVKIFYDQESRIMYQCLWEQCLTSSKDYHVDLQVVIPESWFFYGDDYCVQRVEDSFGKRMTKNVRENLIESEGDVTLFDQIESPIFLDALRGYGLEDKCHMCGRYSCICDAIEQNPELFCLECSSLLEECSCEYPIEVVHEALCPQCGHVTCVCQEVVMNPELYCYQCKNLLEECYCSDMEKVD